VRNWIRRWLGIDQIELWLNLQVKEKIFMLTEIEKLEKQQRVLEDIVGCLIVLNDPLFTIDELNLLRRAESDKLTDEAIRRLYAEQAARDHTVGHS